MAEALTVARTLHLEADDDLAMVLELLGLSRGPRKPPSPLGHHGGCRAPSDPSGKRPRVQLTDSTLPADQVENRRSSSR